jgi:PTH1 family peptidyl-tRNA hydrolase
MIAVDEVQLPVGRYRFRAKGSAGGHNGLKSIEGTLKSQEYPRLRIGVGSEHDRQGDLADFVLGDFGKHEEAVVRELLPSLTEALALWTKSGINPVMNRFTGDAAPSA